MKIFLDENDTAAIIFGLPAHLIAGSITSSLSFVSMILRPASTIQTICGSLLAVIVENHNRSSAGN